MEKRHRNRNGVPTAIVCDIVVAGGKLKLIQIYTIARTPSETNVTALSNEEVDQMVEFVKSATDLNVAGFYGTDTAC